MANPPDIADTDRIALAMIDCTLPKAQWTHEAHLRTGLWHAMRYPDAEALALLRTRIRVYNEATGVMNTDTDGYHETITRLYVHLIGRFVRDADRSRPIDALAADLIRDLGDRELPLTYYSRERLLSKAARHAWLEPDRAELPA